MGWKSFALTKYISVQEKQVAWSVFNTVVCALRFLYRITLGRDWLIQQIPFRQREKKLPVSLSLSEVERFLQAIPNLRHRAILMTASAAGLRVSEVASLRVTDIDSQRMVIRSRQGKGRKDRYVMLSPRLLPMRRAYWQIVRPADCLFPGRRPDKPIVRSTIAWACQKASMASGLGSKQHLMTEAPTGTPYHRLQHRRATFDEVATLSVEGRTGLRSPE